MVDNPFQAPSPSAERQVQLQVACECGAVIPVRPTQAGSEVRCGCERMVEVPNLAALREAAGLRAFEQTADDKVAKLVREGRLPGEHCVVCGTPNREILRLIAECEQIRLRNRGSTDWVILLLLFSPLLVLLRLASRGEKYPADEHGREIVVQTPVRVCCSCYSDAWLQRAIFALRLLRLALIPISVLAFFIIPHYFLPVLGMLFAAVLAGWAARRMHQAKLRGLMGRIDAYQELLDRFPAAVICHGD